MIVVPLSFAVLFGLALVMPISDLGGLPAVYAAYGITDAVPWSLLVLSVVLPVLLYVAALLLGRGLTPFARSLVFTVALAASFCSYFGIVALVTALQPPIVF